MLHRPRAIVLSVAVLAAALTTTPAAATQLRAQSAPYRNNCATSGDPSCAGGQVSNDPALAPRFTTIPNAAPGSVAYASTSYIDPRIGTANGTDGLAAAEFGVLHAASYASVSSSPVLGSSSPNLMRLGTFGGASFTDTLTILPGNPGLIGLPGTFTASFLVDGFLAPSEVSGNGAPSTMAYADWRMEIQVGNSFFGSTSGLQPGFSGYELVDAAGTPTFGNLGATGLVTFSAPIVFGTPFDMRAAFQTQAGAVIDSATARPLIEGLQLASSEAVYVNTASWNGIQAVRLGGQLVSDFTVVSSSGVDYAGATVPEPSVVVSLSMGALVLVALDQRRNALLQWGRRLDRPPRHQLRGFRPRNRDTSAPSSIF